MLRETRTPLKPSSGQSPSTETRETHTPTTLKKNERAVVAVNDENNQHKESLDRVSTPNDGETCPDRLRDSALLTSRGRLPRTDRVRTDLACTMIVHVGEVMTCKVPLSRVTTYTSQICYLTYIRRHTRPMVSIYKLRLVTMQVDALSAKQVSKEAPRLTCQ
jgi:hypothetical protein